MNSRLQEQDAEVKVRVLAHSGFHPDAGAMRLDDVLGDGQAQARAADVTRPRCIDAVEAPEDALLLPP
jgi:hypothetical protein